MSHLLGSKLCTYVALCALWLMATNGHPQNRAAIDKPFSGSSVPQVGGGILPYQAEQQRYPPLLGIQMAQLQVPDPGISGYLYVLDNANNRFAACLDAKGQTLPGVDHRNCAVFSFVMKGREGVLTAGGNRCGVTGYSFKCPSNSYKDYPLTHVSDEWGSRIAYKFSRGQNWILNGNPSKTKGLSPQVVIPGTNGHAPTFWLVFQSP